MTSEAIFSLIFLLILLLLVTGRYHRSVAAMLGALLVIGFGLRYGLFGMSALVDFINFDTVLLVVGVMILCEALARSGLFEFIGLTLANAVGGNYEGLVIAFLFLTVALSAVLSNITSMIIIGALTISLSRKFKADPRRLILYEAVFANIGGLMLMISSIPSMIVASTLNIGFIEFATISIPLAFILALVSILWVHRMIEKTTKVEEALEIDPWSAVRDKGVFLKALTIFVVTLILFLLEDFIKIPLGMIAICGATAMLILSGEEPESIFASVDWGTVFFLVSFYLIVGGLELSGVINLFAQSISALLGFNLGLASIFNIWICALSSSIIDNIPITLTLVPVMIQVSATTGLSLNTLIWSIVFGANLGGNLTPIGSPSNVIALGMLEREGISIGWGEWLRNYAPIACLHLAVSSVYVVFLSVVL